MTSIVWDFDGTLANSYPGMVVAVQDSLKNNFQIELSKDTIYTDIKKTSIRAYVTGLFQDKNETPEEVDRDVKIFYHDYKLLEKQYQDKIRLMPHALNALKYLQSKGVQQFIVTHRDESINSLVKTLGINDFFEEVVSVENGFVRKPDSNMLKYLLDKYTLSPNDLWVIGDRKIDIDFGKSVDAKSILLTDSKSDFGQTKTISDLLEIENMI
ncbi:HAD-IA family hydrolase [Companilactobacillus sp.]|jgi:HAD superfamily hydrolase (TIGR01549 family)|uniref:HAD-IA family hydrolase n=1 Tax=Companilactobacillus sp. TaxID=2767905 RepID=UPI0025B9216A|nr:HAD-IA family hydrolase [Companilactobacillus sp.]MCH4008205.1 HAD-IA family hydrolase [Companilactobacillus sp.]MCH4051616.1 HAD-IA family hydrolase [Companilactobacillus sp.]MCH4076148.1 HAD-IA family hydrolase [Companilactobacillus sp.]MCH4124723.1 HAD-IA family hydrolase [Companilactobacillus sp.]MCH4131265.1 HAD-IA family hydrolase [Companilactobacillus sp.]